MKGKIIIAALVALVLLGAISSCTKKETVNSYDGKCDNCGRTARFGGDGNTEYCTDCFESMLDYVYNN